MKITGIYGGSFNPPGFHHRELVKEMLDYFDEVIVVPCGPRPDKKSVDDIDPIHRAVMADLTFGGLSGRISIDLFDLEQNIFTPTHILEERYNKDGELWHIVGSDLIQGGRSGQSFIQTVWARGYEIWRMLNFAVIERPGYPIDKRDLPPKNRVLNIGKQGSSSEIRERIFKNLPIDGLVTGKVKEYIERYSLYRSRLQQNSGLIDLSDPKVLIRHDKTNPAAVELVKRFKIFESRNPNLILVVGGDGTVLHYARRDWRKRLPIFGINAGHLGYLSNNSDDVIKRGYNPGILKVWHLPLLYVEVVDIRGRLKTALAFNDAFVRNKTNYRRRKLQSAWIEIKVSGPHDHRIPKLIGDGALVATRQGSSAYAKGMGATPIRLGTPELMLAGSNVFLPENLKPVPISINSTVEFINLDPYKRPMEGFVDSDYLGEIISMKIRTSRIASIELAFLADHDLSRKQAESYFPKS